MTDYADFNSEFFDFDNTDNFLNSLSGAVQSLSPESLNGSTEFQPWLDDGKDIGQDFMDQRPVDPGLDFASLSGSDSANTYNSNFDLQAVSMPSNSYSNDSSELTPVSQPSVSSAQTSPDSKHSDYEELVVKKKPAAKSKVTKPKKDKSTHNMIEKKYRSNINTKIKALRDAVPSLRIASGSKDITIADLEGLSPASKLNKASVLTKATEYIKHLEKKNELLRSQNLELQRLIQEANMNPAAYQQTSVSQSPQPAFMSHDSSYSGNIVYNNHQQKPNKYVMGGMAAVVGTSFLSGAGDNDFRGMSALPLFPFQYAPVVQVWQLLKVSLIVFCLASIVVPDVVELFASSKKPVKSLWRNWLQVNLGLKAPVPLDDAAKKDILDRLLGKDANVSSWQLFRDYVQLSCSEPTFESCFLTVIVGSVLTHRFPALSSGLSMNLSMRCSLLANLDYTGSDDALKVLNQLVKNLDGVALFKSPIMTRRLSSLISNKKISFDDGQNNMKFVELLQENSEDFYSLVLSWRILELCNELNLAFLEGSDHEKISKDLKLISELLKDTNSKIAQYFHLFRTALDPNDYVVDLMKLTRQNIDSKLTNFDILVNGQELTDDELIEDSQNEDEEAHPEVEAPPARHSKKLIQELNLISEEEFIILASSLVLYYFNKKDNDKANTLLKYLKFNSESLSLSLLSFTSLYSIVSTLITKESELPKNEVLDQLVRITKSWISDDKKSASLNVDTRATLSDDIVNKGILLNGGNEEDEY